MEKIMYFIFEQFLKLLVPTALQDRVGGRIATFRKGIYVADLGAMVVTGLGRTFTFVMRANNSSAKSIDQGHPAEADLGQNLLLWVIFRLDQGPVYFMIHKEF